MRRAIGPFTVNRPGPGWLRSPVGHPPLRGLDARQPAQRRREADRSATVAAGGQRHHARGDGRPRSPRRASGRPVGPPRVAGRPEGGAGGVALVAELRRGGLAHHDAPGGPQSGHQRRVGRRWRVIDVEGRAVGGGEAGRVLEVLHADRDAGQRAHRVTRRQPLVDGAGLGQGPVAVERRPCVQLRFQLLDARERVADQLTGRQRAALDLVGQLGERRAAEVHGRSLGSRAASTAAGTRPRAGRSSQPGGPIAEPASPAMPNQTQSARALRRSGGARPRCRRDHGRTGRCRCPGRRTAPTGRPPRRTRRRPRPHRGRRPRPPGRRGRR